MTEGFPRLKKAVYLPPHLEKFPGVDVDKFSNLVPLFGYPSVEDVNVDENGKKENMIISSHMRELALNPSFRRTNLYNMPIFVIRRKINDKGFKMDNIFEPYPCALVGIKGDHCFSFAEIVIGGDRGKEYIRADRIFAEETEQSSPQRIEN